MMLFLASSSIVQKNKAGRGSKRGISSLCAKMAQVDFSNQEILNIFTGKNSLNHLEKKHGNIG